jgi:glycosyltransferase involved in cell wall biosynthesis
MNLLYFAYIFYFFCFTIVRTHDFFEKIKSQSCDIFATTLSKARKDKNSGLEKNIEEYITKIEELYHQKFFIILIASFNNIKYFQQNIDSILKQKYENYIAIYMDDISTDGTYEAVKEYLRVKDNQNHFVCIKNTIKKYCLKNYIDSINSYAPNNSIIITLDGDDFFLDDQVLSYLNKIYNNQDVWLTYGQPLSLMTQKPYSEKTFSACGYKIPDSIWKSGLRKNKYWSCFHLRSFYAKLFRMIEDKDLRRPNGEYYTYTEDVAYMTPMFEMCSQKHSIYLNKIMYIYNDSNTLNTGNIIKKNNTVLAFAEIMRKKTYTPLKRLF